MSGSGTGADVSGPVMVRHRLDGPKDGPVVVLSGSLGTALGMWDRQIPALSERLRVLRYDQRGHGRSPVPFGPYSITDLGRDLLALLDRLGLERVALCGLSLGGMTAMWVASHAPERVERLVLCSTSAHLAPREVWLKRAAAVRAGGTGAVAEVVLERWFTPRFRHAHPQTVTQFAQMLRSTPSEGYAGCCEAIADLDLRDRLGAIRAQTLLLAGADDPATPADHAQVIQEAIPGARLLVLPRAAHLANVEQPEAFNRAVFEHLTAARPGGGR